VVQFANVDSKTALTGQGARRDMSRPSVPFSASPVNAQQLLPYSIRVNAVVPAEVVTPLYQQRLQSLPLRRKN
jgi:L-fucose dehydrogenase